MLDGSVGLTKTTGGVVALSGNNTYTGATAIDAGTLQLGAPGVIPNSSAVTVSSGAILDLNGKSETLGSLAGAGTVNLRNAILTTGADHSDTSFSGQLTNSVAGNLVKTGTGTFTLSGTSNNYAGTTTVNAGTLQLGAAGVIPNSSAVTVASGATLDLNGYNETVTSLAGSGTVRTGTGTLTLSNGVTLASSGHLNLLVNGSGAGTFGQVVVTAGNVNLGGAALDTSGTVASSPGQILKILDKQSAGVITGTFNGLAEGDTVTIHAIAFTLSYVGGDGNDVTLTEAAVSSATLTVTESAGSWTISDSNVTGKNNSLTLSSDGTKLILTDTQEKFVTPVPGNATLSADEMTLSIPLADITGSLTIDTAGGNDALTIDFSTGTPIPAGGLTFNGGVQATGGSDTLLLSGGTFTDGRVTPTGTGAGTIVYDALGTITFTGLEPIIDDTTVTNYTINATAAADAITVASAAGSRTQVSEAAGNFESVSFKNKTNVFVNGLGGDDAITLGDNSTPATGLSQLTVDGGAGTGDAITINGTWTLPSGSLALTAETLSQTGGAVSLTTLHLNGPTTQTGGTLAVSGTTTVAAGTGNASLTQAGNDFGTVAAIANNVTIVDQNGIVLGTWGLTGNLDVTAGDAITVSGTQAVAGTARFVTKKDGGAGIALDDASSTFG
ncbi:MAG: autotransporter-associated beta strand repeat-containing protein, partial [Planctomycetota bacterium]|nr:autotransporter-associated beta strand repeat-containing protein [Planctomycetota bacterium]